MDVRAKQRLCLLACLFSLTLRGGGFAPRHLSRRANGQERIGQCIDGSKVFVDDNSGKAKRVIVQVKSGHVKSGDIRDLVGNLDRERGAIGVFITLEKASSHMTNEAASAGFFTSEQFGKVREYKSSLSRIFSRPLRYKP